jgi:hypothetical protein
VLVKKGMKVSKLRQLRRPLQTGCRPAAQQRSSL